MNEQNQAEKDRLLICGVVRSVLINKINTDIKNAQNQLAKACNNYINSKEHKAMIEAFKKVGAIS